MSELGIGSETGVNWNLNKRNRIGVLSCDHSSTHTHTHGYTLSTDTITLSVWPFQNSRCGHAMDKLPTLTLKQ